MEAPRLAKRVLNALLAQEWKDEVLGDLEEQYAETHESRGKFMADLSYWYETLKFLRPHLFSHKTQNTTPMMLLNYFRISYRNLIKNKAYSIVNIVGLALGIASVILISLYLNYQLSFDKFYPDSKRIYRVALERVYPDRIKLFGSSPITLAPVLEENYAQVEAVTRFHKLFFSNEVSLRVDDETYHEPNYRFADKNFFKVFSHEFLYGNPSTALENPTDVVITESIARKYYGTLDALNKGFKVDTIAFTITGVIKDLPSTTHMNFEILGSIDQLPFLRRAVESNSWINPWVYTYIKLKEGTDVAHFELQLPGLVEKFGKGSVAESLGQNYAEEGHAFNYFLQPLEDIHLKSSLDVELAPNGEIKYIYMLALVAIIVLIISSINFINLSTARASERAKEVGIRKVMGSLKTGLVYQFLAESIFITLVSTIVGLFVVYLILPQFNQLLNIPLSLQSLLSPVAILALVGFSLAVGILAGLYPATTISTMQPARVLKGSYKTSKQGLWIRNFLIGFQFFISITMISGAILIHQQMKFFQSKELGFNKDNVAILKVNQPFTTSWDALRNDLLNTNHVEAVGGGFGVPGEFLGSAVMNAIENPGIADFRTNTANFDDHFFGTLGFELAEGRKFEETFNDSLSVLVNEATARLLGDGSAIGKKIKPSQPAQRDQGESPTYTIVGVIKDYHFQSLHSQITPLVIFNTSNSNNFIPPRIAIRFDPSDLPALITDLESVWKQHTEEDFAVSFLSESLMDSYQADIATGKLFDIFTAVAIVMSCIGLFGLATYLLNQKLKEMGVRKILGASMFHIVYKFSQVFMALIGIAFVIAVPLTYYGVQKWLNSFAYSIKIGPQAFLISAAITFILVVITVSYQTLKLAHLNPVETLKDE